MPKSSVRKEAGTPSKPPEPEPSGRIKQNSPTARSLSLQALIALEPVTGPGEMAQATAAPADELLDRLYQSHPLDARDRALTWELVYGVLRYRESLDWRLRQLSDRPLENLPSEVRNALRLGAYQLLHLTRVPASAAVNESVRLAKRVRPYRGRDWSGYVNAVLRGLTRQPPPPWPPLTDHPASALSVRYSCPMWLTARWCARFGVTGAEQVCRQTLAIPPLIVRANTLKTDRDRLAVSLEADGHGVERTHLSSVGLTIERTRSITTWRQFQAGELYVEDEAAQLVPLLLGLRRGERVLDACAAPGGKATHMAALMQNEGEIVALDHSLRRLALLQENCRRLGVNIVHGFVRDVRQDLRDMATAPFDRILLDAPCSGLGVLRRHPEGKWHKREEHLAQHHETQLTMLKGVAELLRPGGVLVYSTCSTEPDENERVVLEFCRSNPAFQLEPAGLLLTEAQQYITQDGYLSTALNADGMDGFFAARLRRI